MVKARGGISSIKPSVCSHVQILQSVEMTCMKEALSNHSPTRGKRVRRAEVKPKERGRA